MAHRIKVMPYPHTNRDGTKSKTKKDYKIIDHHRGKQTLVGVVGSRDMIQKVIDDHREQIVARHLLDHPNDHAFKEKHKIKESNNV